MSVRPGVETGIASPAVFFGPLAASTAAVVENDREELATVEIALDAIVLSCYSIEINGRGLDSLQQQQQRATEMSRRVRMQESG